MPARYKIDTLAKSILGNNCKKVDITANGVLNDLATPNMNTYSINSTTNSSTLFSMEVDEIGNMTKFNGYDFNWNGRRLESISQDGVELISYKYNIDGQRVSKTVGGTTTEYFYNGDILAGQKTGNDVLIFMYDNNGDVFGFTYNGTPYYYIKNAQNDVYMIVDETGVAQVLYMYDAWGRIGCYDATNFGLATINPLMYRSYYLDVETGYHFYYLNSRYYLADLGRFINADSYVQTGQGMLDKNMFAYCGNNPVNRIDPAGQSWEDVKNWFSEKWNALKDWAKNTFGASSSTTNTLSDYEVSIIPDPSPITIKTGNTITQTVSKSGDSSKPISVYSDKNLNHPVKSSSAGVLLNISKFSLDISVGCDNIGIAGSWTEGNTTNSLGLRVNLNELKMGLEQSTSIQWDETTETTYTNVSANAWAIAALYVFFTTGQTVPESNYSYA